MWDSDQTYSALLTSICRVSFDGWADGFDGAYRWVQRLTANLVTVVGEAEVRFVTGRPLDQQGVGGTACVVVFTDNCVVRADVENVGEYQPKATITVRSRATLQSVSTVDPGSVDSQPEPGKWTRRQRLVLTYSNADSITVPMVENAPRHHEDALLAFLPDLLRDIAK